MSNHTSTAPATPADAPLLVDAKRAAAMLSISPRTLWALTNCGDIRCVRIGRAVRYDPADLTAYCEAHKRRGVKP